MGATTHEGALTKQLPELVLDELLDELETLDELLLKLDDVLDELEEFELDELEELPEDEPPPQPATVSAPSALNACRRVK